MQIPPEMAHTVLFFHGLSGLENACDAGQARQCVPRSGSAFVSKAACDTAGWTGPERRPSCNQSAQSLHLQAPGSNQPLCGLPTTVVQIHPGQFVLFNGASFLADLSASGLQVRGPAQAPFAWWKLCESSQLCRSPEGLEQLRAGFSAASQGVFGTMACALCPHPLVCHTPVTWS